MRETWDQSLGWADPLEKEWQPTPGFLPGESHGERNLTVEIPCAPKELNTTKVQLFRDAIQKAMDAETKKTRKQQCSY